jgi:nitrogen fixation protein FixH
MAVRWTGGLVLGAWLLTGCGQGPRFEPLATGTVDGTEVTVAAPAGHLAAGPGALRVTFRDPGGAPLDVDGAAITLRAAITQRAPTEGTLAAVRQDVSLAHRGAGIYEGRFVLSQSGLWHGEVQWRQGSAIHHWTFATTVP